MNDDRIIKNLRNMAWERAKGELRSMIHTFWNKDTGDYFMELDHEIEQFIKRVEDHGWHE